MAEHEGGPGGSPHVQISIRLPADLVSRMDKFRGADERSRTYVIKKALEQFLPAEEPPKQQRRIRHSVHPGPS